MGDVFDDEADYRRKVFDRLGEYHSGEEIPSDAISLQSMLNKESHRGLVIILATYIEDALVERICRELPNGEELRKVLKSGPLRNFEHRITLARATGVITARHADVLTVIRHMRNACAHCRRDISFATPILKETFLLLLPPMREAEMKKDNANECAGNFILTASRMLMVLEGAPEDEIHAAYERVSEMMEADGRKGLVQTEWVLFEALRKRRTSRSSQGPPRPTSGQAR
jgi:hypothetical protein